MSARDMRVQTKYENPGCRFAHPSYACYDGATAPEYGNAENLKFLSFGSSGSASKRRAIVMASTEPCSRLNDAYHNAGRGIPGSIG
jgi:hypothetical protein